jgi:hypothetical protein
MEVRKRGKGGISECICVLLLPLHGIDDPGVIQKPNGQAWSRRPYFIFRQKNGQAEGQVDRLKVSRMVDSHNRRAIDITDGWLVLWPGEWCKGSA